MLLVGSSSNMTRLLAFVFIAGMAQALLAPRSAKLVSSPSTRARGVEGASFKNNRLMQLAAMPDDDEPELFGGYTAKQRMREEIESPFRKVRLIFFGASTGSALLALYFSILNVAKAATGGIPVSNTLIQGRRRVDGAKGDEVATQASRTTFRSTKLCRPRRLTSWRCWPAPRSRGTTTRRAKRTWNASRKAEGSPSSSCRQRPRPRSGERSPSIGEVTGWQFA